MSKANQSLIEMLRKRAADGFATLIVDALPSVAEKVGQIGKSSSDADSKRIYASSASLLQTSTAELMQILSARFTEQFDKKTNAIAGVLGGRSTRIPLDSLSLVDDFEMQETIAISKSEKQLKELCEYELYALGRRLESLLGVDLITDEMNPFYTKVFCRILMDALGDIGLIHQSKLVAFAAIEPILLAGMLDFYKMLNGVLIGIGILVEVPAPHEGRVKNPNYASALASARTASAQPTLTLADSPGGGAGTGASPHPIVGGAPLSGAAGVSSGVGQGAQAAAADTRSPAAPAAEATSAHIGHAELIRLLRGRNKLPESPAHIDAARLSQEAHPLFPTLSRRERVRNGPDESETSSGRINRGGADDADEIDGLLEGMEGLEGLEDKPFEISLPHEDEDRTVPVALLRERETEPPAEAELDFPTITFADETPAPAAVVADDIEALSAPPEGAEADGLADPNGPLSQTWMEQLKGMQLLAVPMPGAVDLGMTMPLPMLHNVDGVPTMVPGAIDMIRRKFQRDMRPIDAMIVEMTYTFFAEMLADRRLLWPVRELLSQMQITVLRATLLDSTVLTNDSHPVNQFLDCIADIGMKYGAEMQQGNYQYERVVTVIQYVCTQFDADFELFDVAIRHFSYTAEDIRNEFAAVTEEAIERATFEEQRELGIGVGEYEVKRRVAALHYPKQIVDFLLLCWGRLLAKDYLEFGEGSPAWKADIETLDDIVAITRVAKMGDRDSLRDRTPMLMRGLNAGMERMRVPAPQREAFLQEFFAYTVNMVRSIRGEIVSPATVEESSTDLESNELPDPRELPNPVAGLVIGQWFHILSTSGLLQRARLVWISPRNLRYVFKDFDDQIALVFGAQEIREKLESAEIRPQQAFKLVAPCLKQVMAAFSLNNY
ncbi:MAG: DUF1631 family protein [Betaproteobacteria bacterium]|nr:DUF1631 family protein [Betaproteobacteria bacterium]